MAQAAQRGSLRARSGCATARSLPQRHRRATLLAAHITPTHRRPPPPLPLQAASTLSTTPSLRSTTWSLWWGGARRTACRTGELGGAGRGGGRAGAKAGACWQGLQVLYETWRGRGQRRAALGMQVGGRRPCATPLSLPPSIPLFDHPLPARPPQDCAQLVGPAMGRAGLLPHRDQRGV